MTRTSEEQKRLKQLTNKIVVEVDNDDFYNRKDIRLSINNQLVAIVFPNEGHGMYDEYDELAKGFVESGHLSSIILHDFDGVWLDNEGNEISGQLYFKPNIN